MKLLKSKGDAFDFKFDGKTTISITPEGVIVSDIVANTALERFAVIVSEVPEQVENEIPVIEVVEHDTIPVIDPISDPMNSVEEINPNQ